MQICGPPRQCLICYRPAYCNNYGALTCDACKMFFRRVMKEHLFYQCKTDQRCFEAFRGGRHLPACKACRHSRCKEIGMIFANKSKKRIFVELKNDAISDVWNVISKLLIKDKTRADKMATCFTVLDPSVKEMVENQGDLRGCVKTRDHPMTPSDWSFFALYTTMEFLLDLKFMSDPNSKLMVTDKVILLQNFTGQASLFAGAMRTFRQKRDRLMTVDGHDIYPDYIKSVIKLERSKDQVIHSEFRLPNGDDNFLERIRSLLVARLIELKITNEEFVLVTVLLFCNPTLDGLSEVAIPIVTTEQNIYSSLLFQYCQLHYQRAGPSRFTELLSVCSVIRRNFEDVQFLTMMFGLAMKGVKYKKIVAEVI